MAALTNGRPRPGRAQEAAANRERRASATGPRVSGGGKRGAAHVGQRNPAGAVRGGRERQWERRQRQCTTSADSAAARTGGELQRRRRKTTAAQSHIEPHRDAKGDIGFHWGI